MPFVSFGLYAMLFDIVVYVSSIAMISVVSSFSDVCFIQNL